MSDNDISLSLDRRSHVFLGSGHEKNERKTWAVIFLCTVMMVVEIGGGSLYGSLALVADGLHMSTHAAAMLIAALAYTYARRYAGDPRFGFGTGKFGDLAGFSSAIILAMIALLIGYDAITRLFQPVPIDFDVAIPIAGVGLVVNLASAWLLSGDHDHAHGHGHSHGHDDHGHGDTPHRIETGGGAVSLKIVEEDVPPRFRLAVEGSGLVGPVTIETVRSDGRRQLFNLTDRGLYLESVEEVPEPHDFTARVMVRQGDQTDIHEVVFAEHHHGHHAAHRDNNMRAAFVHVLADAAVSVLAIVGLAAGKFFGWNFMDPVMGIIGMLVIANWSIGLIRDTGAILLDMLPDRRMAARIRDELEADGDRLTDFHLWRLGPGHLGAIVEVATRRNRDAEYYRQRLSRFSALSHVTVEVRSASAG
jgi:cation diffusion facilitator family transporter